MNPQIEIQLIAIFAALSCSLIGVFLILRKSSLISEAISHSILFGIVLAYIIAGTFNSVFLIGGAILTGLITVVLSELLSKNKLIKKDAAIGIVYTFLFSIGIILLSKYATRIHIDTNSVLLGELVFAPYNRLIIWGIDIGSVSLITNLTVLIINLLFIIIFIKELKITTFDPELSYTFGYPAGILNYALMVLTSVTVVAAFDAVGSILVVSFIIVPAATSYLISGRLRYMIINSLVFAVISAEAGYWLAHFLDTSVSGTISIVSGMIFSIVFIIKKI
jgi:manganese/zinc/iron transport system permease protein